MSDLLAIGRSGVVAYRAALSAVGENVANSETEGYSRRTVTIKESNLSSSSSYQYKSQTYFGGSNVGSVDRIANDYKASYVRLSTSEDARASTKATWLSTAEGALNDTDVGLGVKMSTVFTSVESLTADVDSNPNRQAVIAAVTEAAQQFNATAKALKDTSDGINTAALTSVASLNDSLTALAQINQGLRRASPGSVASAQLLDRRDAVLNDVSKLIGVDVRFEEDGRASVSITGNNAVQLLDANRTDTAYLGAVQSSDGRISLIASGALLGAQQSISPQSGSLSALVDVASTVADRRQKLDSIATTFANTINTWNRNGVDQNGAAGGDLLTIGAGGASTIVAATQDTTKVAAASTAGVRNGNALVLKDTRNSTGAEAQWALLVSTHAQAVSSANAQATAASSQKDGALLGLDEVTGVDLDDEAAQLLRFQQAYSGSAKIIQVARETLQEIMNLFS